MTVLDVIKSKFESETIHWLAKNFDTHVNYLKTIFLKKYSGDYNDAAFDKALQTFKANNGKGAKQLCGVLEVALNKMLADEQRKGDKLVMSHKNGNLKIKDNGNWKVSVQSESRDDLFYGVDLQNHTCTCKQFERIKYGGMWCKHIIAAHEVFSNKYPLQQLIHKTSYAIPKSEKEDDMNNGQYFCYGSQALTKRNRTGNPFIPSEHEFVLDGGEPEIVLYALDNNESLLLIGDSGVGKSMMIHFLAQETYTPLIAPSAHADMTVENLLGSMTATNGNTVWKNGVIPEAMRKGYWLMIDELNSIDPGVLKVLNELLDTNKITITVAGEPRVVKAHKDFRLVCTMNPPDNPIYKGIETFSFEFMDRFDTVVYLDYLKPNIETQLIIDKTGFSDSDTVAKMIDFANRVRQGMRKGELFATVTTRGLLSWAKKIDAFDIRTAAEVSILRKMSEADRNKALDLYQAIFKD